MEPRRFLTMGETVLRLLLCLPGFDPIHPKAGRVGRFSHFLCLIAVTGVLFMGARSSAYAISWRTPLTCADGVTGKDEDGVAEPQYFFQVTRGNQTSVEDLDQTSSLVNDMFMNIFASFNPPKGRYNHVLLTVVYTPFLVGQAAVTNFDLPVAFPGPGSGGFFEIKRGIYSIRRSVNFMVFSSHTADKQHRVRNTEVMFIPQVPGMPPYSLVSDNDATITVKCVEFERGKPLVDVYVPSAKYRDGDGDGDGDGYIDIDGEILIDGKAYYPIYPSSTRESPIKKTKFE